MLLLFPLSDEERDVALMGSEWLVGVVLLIGGALLGGFLTRIFGPDSGREKQLQEELDRTRSEFSTYRNDVETHFRETAEAVNAMTESYRRVYDKLRTGATRLCGESGQLLDLKPAPLLERSEPEVSGGSDETTSRPEEAAPIATQEAEGETPSPDAEEAGTASAREGEDARNDATPEAAATEAESPPEEPRAPLDYPVEGEDEEREKILH